MWYIVRLFFFSGKASRQIFPSSKASKKVSHLIQASNCRGNKSPLPIVNSFSPSFPSMINVPVSLETTFHRRRGILPFQGKVVFQSFRYRLLCYRYQTKPLPGDVIFLNFEHLLFVFSLIFEPDVTSTFLLPGSLGSSVTQAKPIPVVQPVQEAVISQRQAKNLTTLGYYWPLLHSRCCEEDLLVSKPS